MQIHGFHINLKAPSDLEANLHGVGLCKAERVGQQQLEFWGSVESKRGGASRNWVLVISNKRC